MGNFLDNIFENNSNTPVGFDVKDSPFASLRDNNSDLFVHQKYVVFSVIAQGYVFLKPLEELHGVTWAKGFVNKENFEQFEDFLWRRGQIQKNEYQTPEELNEKMKQWHDDKMKQRWGK